MTVWVFGCFGFAGGGFMYPIFQFAFRSTCVSRSQCYVHSLSMCVCVWVWCTLDQVTKYYVVLSTHLQYVWICMYIGTHTHAHTWPHAHAKIRNLSRSLEILRVAFHFSWIPSRPLLLASSLLPVLLLLLHFSLRFFCTRLNRLGFYASGFQCFNVCKHKHSKHVSTPHITNDIMLPWDVVKLYRIGTT